MNKYHDTIVKAASKAGNQLPHWKIARIAFEEALESMLEQEKQQWWEQQDQDAEAGNLSEWTDE